MGDIRVLVVDDDNQLRRVLRTHFDQTPGYSVIDEAADGREALALATLLQPDVIVLDSMMPGLDGVDALPALADAVPSSIIVLFSAVVEAPAIGRFSRDGAAAIVPKADGVDTLHRVVEELVADRTT
jgi:two-component system, NarL family, nitrate/nitrite response regulator NarL